MSISLSNKSISGSLSVTGDASVSGSVRSIMSSGDEGGELFLSKAQTNTTLNTGVTVDVYKNKLRIFETGGDNRGFYLDLASASSGVGSNLASGAGSGSGTVTSVALSVPTGLSVSGSPITSSGTLAISLASGYTIPTTSQLNSYLTSYTETDPIYTASSWYTTTNNSSNWNTAYGWGNHASAGYLTSLIAASTYAPLDSPTFTGNISLENNSSIGPNNGGLYISSDGIVSLEYSYGVQLPNTTVQSLTVSGDLIVNGTTTTVNASNLEVTDSLIYLASQQYDTDAVDIGIFGAYGDAGAGHNHTGLVRDASDGIWKLISNATEPTSNVIDFTGVTYDTLKVGGLQVGSVTNTEIGYLSGVTSSIQTQIGNKLSTNIAQSANLVYAGPNTGTAANPSFRSLVDADIPALAASKITSGTFDTARIPSLSADIITSGTLGVDRIPSLAASKITSGTFDSARIPTLNQDTTGTAAKATSAGLYSATAGGYGTPTYSRIFVGPSAPTGITFNTGDVWISI